jgi:TolB-like protein/Tfp pilus assembly protein PilF
LALALAAFPAAALFWAEFIPAPSSQVGSLVVLPFENLGPDKNDEYFGDGLTEELINRLSSVKGLRVLARTTAFHLKGRTDDVRALARRLNVEAILAGSVRRQGDRLRVTAHLSRGSDGVQLWSQVFDRQSDDLFVIQEEISNTLVSRLGNGAGPALPRRAVRSQGAHRLLLLGNFHRSKFERTDLEKAIHYYQDAIRIDPQFAEPYAEMAYAYAALGNALLRPPAEVYPAALSAARKAVAMDGSIPAAHTGLGIYHLAYAWDWEQAEAEFRRALALNPCEAQAHHWYSHYFAAMGRFPESLESARRAIECDPLALDLSHHLAEHFCAARDFERCIAFERKTLELDSRYVLALWKLGVAYEAQDRLTDAIRLHGQSATARRLEAALGRSGRRGYWLEKAALLMEERDPSLVAPFLSFAYAQAGDKQKALDWLEQTFAARSFWMINIRNQWELDPLRGQARFQELLRRMRFP